MANKFEFKNNGVTLDFGNVQYNVDATNPELIESILEFSKGATDKAEELKGNDDYVKELRSVISFILGAIDSILGEGASEDIFEGRSVSMFDALEVMDYITKEVIKGKDKQFEKYNPANIKKVK